MSQFYIETVISSSIPRIKSTYFSILFTIPLTILETTVQKYSVTTQTNHAFINKAAYFVENILDIKTLVCCSSQYIYKQQHNNVYNIISKPAHDISKNRLEPAQRAAIYNLAFINCRSAYILELGHSAAKRNIFIYDV